MPVVNFSITRDANFNNTITFSGYGTSFTLGPSAGSASANLVSGGIYNLSAGSNGGNPRLQVLNASCIGLEDADDNDYNDLIVCANSGSFLNDSQYQAPWDPVSINSFTVSPDPQTSGNDSTPNDDVTLSWNTTAAVSASINQGVGNVSVNGAVGVNTGLQSVAGSNSPAEKIYTLTAVGGAGDTQTAQVTARILNDNNPDNFTISNQTGLSPSTLTSIDVGQITGIDMLTGVNAGPGVQVSLNNSNWTSSTLISNNQPLWVRAVSPPFNTDPSGSTNSSQFYVDVGPLRRFFTLTTRAPDVNETFNYPNEDDRVPFPDIDTLPDPAEPYIISNTLTVDDIDIPVEIRTNNSNAQIRKKVQGSSTWGNWTDIRSI